VVEVDGVVTADEEVEIVVGVDGLGVEADRLPDADGANPLRWFEDPRRPLRAQRREEN
jgi:hypothetical protein